MENEEDILFHPAPYFMVRVPFLPLCDFQDLLLAKNPEKWLLTRYRADPTIREAIAVASPSLYSSMEGYEGLNQKKRSQSLSSLFKYVLRMATRATPFGLFSFVNIGQWAKKSEIRLDFSNVKKIVRPDMGWLIQVLDKLSADPSLTSKLKVQCSPLLEFSLNRIILSYYRKEEKSAKEEISIQENPLTHALLSRSKTSINAGDLAKWVMEDIEGLEFEKVLKVITSLIQQNFLLPSFYPSLLGENPFQDVIHSLKCDFPNHQVVVDLEEISKRLDCLNDLAIGEGIGQIKEIERLMEAKAQSKTLLQVDSYTHQKTELSEEVAKKLSDAISVLWKLSKPQVGSRFLRPYHMQFLEKYGTYRSVPILEIIDETKGIGFPEYRIEEEITEEDRSWDQALKIELGKCHHDESREIILTDQFVHENSHETPFEEAPSSFDVYCEIVANSAESVDEGDFLVYLHPVSGAGDGGSTFGRFLYTFSSDTKKRIKSFIQEEEENHPHLLYAESSYFPTSSRSANVAINPHFRSSQIDLGYSKKGLQLEDIHVGATIDYLYLSFRGEKEMQVVSMNALNPEIGPQVARLMREISKDRFRFLLPFNWGTLADLPFKPRVRYKNIILSPASWTVTLNLIDGKEKNSQEILIKKFKTWAEKWNLPRHIFMTVADNRILLDRTQDYHLKEIVRKLKNEPSSPVVLAEKVGSGEWVESNRGKHFSEFVISFMKAKKWSNQATNIRRRPQVPFSSRMKPPGSEWLYLKLFLPKKNEPLFLVNSLMPFIEAMDSDINKWFFIRYIDEKRAHIRLRFVFNQKESKKNVLLWASGLVEKGWLLDFSLGIYEREVERYGGVHAISQAEIYFKVDSMMALALIQAKQRKSTPLPLYVLVSISLIEILLDWGLNLESQIQFFTDMKLEKKQLEGFREWKAQLVEIFSGIHEGGRTLYPSELKDSRARALLELKQAVPQKDQPFILNSLCHMHCNRTMGTDHQLEQKAYLFALNALKNLQKKQALVSK